MLTIPILLVGVLFFWLGWKARSKFDDRPRWLKWNKKKDPAATANGTSYDKKDGRLDWFSRTGEKIIGKGIETFFGKPRGPKDDEEDE